MIAKSDVKQFIIQGLLEEECPHKGSFYEQCRDEWDVERQALVLRCGWNKMTAEQLLAQLPE